MGDMTREEAAKEIIRVLQKPATSTGVGTGGNRFEQALCLAVDALHSRWVKTADRLPTEADAGDDGDVVARYRHGETEVVGCDYWKFVANNPKYFPYWMPLPKLPEVEG